MVTFQKFMLIFLVLLQVSQAKSKIELKEGSSTPLPGATASMNKKDCEKVDLTKKMGPVREQLGAACYAYTATDLINFGNKTPLSALFLAQTYDKYGSEIRNGNSPLSQIKGLNGGVLSLAVDHGLEQGMCPESIIPSIDSERSSAIFYEDILEYYKKATDLGCKQLQLTVLENFVGISDKVSIQLDAWYDLKSVIDQTYPGFDLSKLEGIFKNTPPEKFFSAICREACKDKLIKIKNKKVNSIDILEYDKDGKWYFSPKKRVQLLAHINQTLSNGKPIGVTYETKGLLQVSGKSQSTHTSAIAGRVWKNGCYYLVKNSWGEDWKVPNGLKAKPVNNMPGYFMMSEQSLLEHVHGSISLD